jgi:ribosomal protein L7/L12
MTDLNDVSVLDDSEADQLWRKLNEIMKLSDRMVLAADETSAHTIYKLARDCRDLLVFDQQSRELMRKLTVPESYAGFELSDTVKALVKENRKIEAIMQMRTEVGCGLKEAKDAVEAYMSKMGITTW